MQTRYASVQRKWKSSDDGKRFNQFRRPKYLFSGLTKGGECGAGFVVYSREHLGCFGARGRGTCTSQHRLGKAGAGEELEAQLRVADERPPLLHPSMADLYRNKMEELASALRREDTRLEASEMLRGLVRSS